MRMPARLLTLILSLAPSAFAAPVKKILSSDIKAKAEFAGGQSVSEIKTSISTSPEEAGLEQPLGGYTGKINDDPISGHFAVIVERPHPREVLYKFRVYRQATGEPSEELISSPQILTGLNQPAKVKQDDGHLKLEIAVLPREIPSPRTHSH